MQTSCYKLVACLLPESARLQDVLASLKPFVCERSSSRLHSLTRSTVSISALSLFIDHYFHHSDAGSALRVADSTVSEFEDRMYTVFCEKWARHWQRQLQSGCELAAAFCGTIQNESAIGGGNDNATLAVPSKHSFFSELLSNPKWFALCSGQLDARQSGRRRVAVKTVAQIREESNDCFDSRQPLERLIVFQFGSGQQSDDSLPPSFCLAFDRRTSHSSAMPPLSPLSSLSLSKSTTDLRETSKSKTKAKKRNLSNARITDSLPQLSLSRKSTEVMDFPDDSDSEDDSSQSDSDCYRFSLSEPMAHRSTHGTLHTDVARKRTRQSRHLSVADIGTTVRKRKKNSAESGGHLDSDAVIDLCSQSQSNSPTGAVQMEDSLSKGEWMASKHSSQSSRRKCESPSLKRAKLSHSSLPLYCRMTKTPTPISMTRTPNTSQSSQTVSPTLPPHFPGFLLTPKNESRRKSEESIQGKEASSSSKRRKMKTETDTSIMTVSKKRKSKVSVSSELNGVCEEKRKPQLELEPTVESDCEPQPAAIELSSSYPPSPLGLSPSPPAPAVRRHASDFIPGIDTL